MTSTSGSLRTSGACAECSYVIRGVCVPRCSRLVNVVPKQRSATGTETAGAELTIPSTDLSRQGATPPPCVIVEVPVAIR